MCCKKFRGGKSANDWLLFLDADDRLLPNCLETLANLAERYPEAHVYGGNYLRVSGDKVSEACHYSREGIVSNPIYHYFFNHFSIRAGAMMLRREVFLKHPFDTQFHRWEDLKWGLDILRECKVCVTPVPLMEYNLETTQMSKPLKDKTADFAFHAEFRGKSFWEKLCLGRMLFFSHFASPEDARMLRHTYGIRYHYATLANILLKIQKTIRLICHH